MPSFREARAVCPDARSVAALGPLVLSLFLMDAQVHGQVRDLSLLFLPGDIVDLLHPDQYLPENFLGVVLGVRCARCPVSGSFEWLVLMFPRAGLLKYPKQVPRV